MNAYLKAAFDCFMDKSLLKCLVGNDNVNNAYLMTSLVYVTLKVDAIFIMSVFGLTVSPVQQRLNLRGCNKMVMIWPRCASRSYWHWIAI